MNRSLIFGIKTHWVMNSILLPEWQHEIHQCSKTQAHRVPEEQLVQESGSTDQHHMGRSAADPPPLKLPCMYPSNKNNTIQKFAFCTVSLSILKCNNISQYYILTVFFIKYFFQKTFER